MTLASVIVIAVVCLSVQFLRRDLDWITTAMSMYVYGPWGTWVRASFFAPVFGLAALGLGWHRAIRVDALSDAALALFLAAAFALCLAGAFTTDPSSIPTTTHGTIHQWAAFATFVCATTAMLVQSWLFRLDPESRKHFIEACVIAAIAIVYFWTFALFKRIPRGVGEKAVIALVLLWMWRAGWWLLRDRRRQAARMGEC